MASPVQIFCPNCALQISIEERLIGNKGQCPRCSHKFIISGEHRHPPDGDDLGTAPTIKIVKDEAFDFDLEDARDRWVGSQSFVVGLVGLLLLLVAAGAALVASGVSSSPGWMKFVAGLHGPLGYGSMALLLSAGVMELLGRAGPFEHLHAALPFILAMAVFGVFVANVAGACSLLGWGSHVGMAFVAGLMATLALVMATHLQDRPESDRAMILVFIALSMGALLVVAHLGKTVFRGL